MSLGCVSTAELREQAHEAWVRALVVDDEAGIDRDRAVDAVDVDGLDVATRPGVALEHDDTMVVAQGPGRTQAADPGADDRDVHRRQSAAARRSSVRCMPSRASRAIRANAPPANGVTSRSRPRSRMSAV